MPVAQLTVCGVAELAEHATRGVTHVVTLLDPGSPEPAGLAGFGRHHRTIFHFHDILVPEPGKPGPTADLVSDLLGLGRAASANPDGHLLVHCHMGVSRSTATMLMLMAQAQPDVEATGLFRQLIDIRPQAWPNSRMVALADDRLGRAGTLTAELRRHYGRQLKVMPQYRSWMAELGRQSEVDMAL